jgi:hypothetical protein
VKALLVVLNILAVVLGNQAQANVSTDRPVPIGHCYHWLQSSAGYLDFKYDYAKKNGNELTFYTSPATSNGSVAGPGLYCAKSPSESFGYGDRVIRIELVDDIVILDATSGKNYCGHNGRYYANDAECQAKDWDIKYYNHSPDWYVIQNPRAVKSWSATSPNVIEDLQEEMRYAGGEYSSHARTTIQAINADVQKNGVREMINARARMGFAELIKDEKLLKSLPAMTVLGEIVRSEKSKIDKTLLAKVLADTVTRVLEDDYLPWADVKPIFKGNKKIKQAFTDGIQKQLAGLGGAKANGQKNFDVMLLFAGQKDSGITAEQIKVLIAETFKNPSNFGQTRFAKGDLSEDLKAGLVAELTRRLAMPGTKNDLSLLASLVTFVSINNIDAKAKSDVTAMYYEFVKSMTASKFFLSDRKNKYPLGDTTQIATQLCQANIAAYNLVNKDLSIGSGEVAIGVGQISNISNSVAFCQQQTSLMDVLATIPKKGDAPLQTIRGNIEGINFKFVVIDSESTEAQLRSFLLRNQISSTSGMVVQMNNETIFNYNSYYALSSADDIVAVVLDAVNTKGVFKRSQLSGLSAIAEKSKGKSKKIEVTFSNISPVTFKIDTVEDFNDQCALLAPTLDQNEITNVYMKFKELETSVDIASVKDSKVVCAIARESLFTWKVPSLAFQKNATELARLKAGKKKSLAVNFGTYQFNFKINTIEDLEAQCLLHAPMFENYPVTEVSWDLDDGERSNSYSSDPFTLTTSTTCASLTADVMTNGEVPSQKYLNALAQLKAMGRDKKIKVNILFDDLNADFTIDSIEDFKDQCPILSSTLQGRQVQYVSATVNEQGQVSASGPFATAKDMCDGAVALLLDNGVPSRKHAGLIAQLRKSANGKTYQIPLVIQGTDILFGVNSMEELVSQCQYLGDMFDGRNIETVGMPIKGQENLDISPRTALKSSKEVCDFIRESFIDEVPSKVIADIAAKKSQSRYSFMVMLDSLPLTFALNSMKEFDKQCDTLVKASGKDTVYNIGVQKDANWKPRIAYGGGIDANDFCGVIKATVEAGFIPSQEQEDVFAIQGRKYVVEATLEGMPFTFKVDSRDQLNGQCLNLTDNNQSFSEGINDIQFRVNGGKITTLDTGLSVRAACRHLAKSVKL